MIYLDATKYIFDSSSIINVFLDNVLLILVGENFN